MYETKTYYPQGSRRRQIRALTEAGFEALIKEACAASAPRDAQIEVDGEDYHARIEVERGFAAEATLYIRARTVLGDSELAEDENENQVKIHYRKLEIEINWSATSRNLSNAAAAIDIYNDMLRLGNHINATLSGYSLVRVREIPQPETA
jgi:hypothetical protein